PDFPQRGLMLDISRCKVPKMETLFDIVDLMARLKLNQLQLYTEHTFAFSEHEVVWHDASPMTPEEILELDAYCRDRYVELVPNQNSFGHFGRWLRHPEYKHLAECPDGFETSWHRWPNGTTLKPTRASLQLLDSLYGELLPNFTSNLFNVGCDETWELGKGWSKKRCEEGGTTRVYLDFLVKIAHLVRKHKRTMMFWGDIILHQPELIHELPEDVIGLVWGYEFDEAFSRKCRQFKEAGARFYVCPGTSSWNSLAGRTDNCFGNLENAARSGLRHGAIGFLNTDWGDGGHLHYWPISYPGVFMGAALSWSFKANRDADVAGAIDSLALADEAHVLGQLLLDVGRVLNLIPRRFYNCSPFYDLLFREIGKEHLPEGVTASPLKKCLQKFDQLEARLADARPGCEDGELVKAEIKNAIAMARFATRRALAGLDEEYLDRPGLRHALQHAIWQHEELWLARNRRGGLRESSGALRAQLADLE
ncbi:MAG: beta-N-acetylhexosaminidase, partial [Planctomycetota bacterium]